jgi:hypothetical protein
VIVKVDTPGTGAHSLRAGYLQHGKGRDGADAPLYGPGAQDPQRFTRQQKDDHHRFTLMVSFAEVAQVDRTAFINQYMRQVERDLDTPLDWMAADHYDTAHPHTHIVVRGVSAGEDLYMKPTYYFHGLREQASRLLTRMAGPVREREQTLELAQFRAYQESLGRGPRRLNGIILGSEDPDAGQLARQQALSRPQAPPERSLPPLYGHEGMAAHLQQLWQRLQGPQYQSWPNQEQLREQQQRERGR